MVRVTSAGCRRSPCSPMLARSPGSFQAPETCGRTRSRIPSPGRDSSGLGLVHRLSQGLVQNFLNAQTTTIGLNGAAPVDISDSYGAIEPHPDEGFGSRIRRDTGVTLAAGESLRVDGMLAVSHVVPDGVKDETTPERPLRPGLVTSRTRSTDRCRRSSIGAKRLSQLVDVDPLNPPTRRSRARAHVPPCH